VAATPTLVVAGALHPGPPSAAILQQVRNQEETKTERPPIRRAAQRKDNHI
jgi:hypothetical protein